MATYLSGVTDYIPDYQPFQPDLNFYNNVLQAKQTQYDTNWKSLNNVYAEMHNADLTHDQNIKKKDELLKQIDFNLKRVTGLDLSLEQNVDDATQVFRPFYEDKYLMKDMAWTKNYGNTLSSALNLQNAQDEKIRGQFWSTGIKELQYRREEFKEATLDETLNMSNVAYTPKVDVYAKYAKIAKDSGLNFDIKDVDESGMYFVHEKGGEKLIPPLQSLFLSAYANDPELQAKYSTEAYVQRKDYAVQHASEFGGNKVEAEKAYLKEQYNFLKNYTAKQNDKAQEDVKVNENLINSAQKDVENGEEGLFTGSLLDRLNKAITINQTVADHTEQVHNSVTDANSENGPAPELDLSNLELARLRVDAGTSSWQAEQDIARAAHNEAFRDYKYEKSVNPIGLEGLKQQNALSRMSYAHDLKMQEMDYKTAQDRETNRINQGLANGTISYDKDGNIHEDFGDAFTMTLGSTSGQFTDEFNAFADNADLRNEKTANLTGTYIGNTLQRLRTLAQTGGITNQQLWSALSHLDPNSKEASERYGTTANSNLSGYKLLNVMWDRYQANPGKFVQNFSKSGQVMKLKSYMDKWAMNMNGNKIADNYLADASRFDVEKYVRYKESADIIDEHNYKKIYNGLAKTFDSLKLNVKEENKKKIVDAYLTLLRTNKQADKQAFDNLINQTVNYGKPKRNTDYDNEGVGSSDQGYINILGGEGYKKFYTHMAKQAGLQGDKIEVPGMLGMLAGNMPDRTKYNQAMDRQAIAYLKDHLSDARFKELTKGRNITKDEYIKNVVRNYSAGNLKGYKSYAEATGIDTSDIFDKFSKSYLKIVNGTGPEGLKSYRGVVRTPDGRYALGTNDVTAKKVNLANPNYGGFQDFQEIMADINRIRFNQDPTKYAVTYGGLTKTAADENMLDPAEMKAMLREMQMSAGKGSKERFLIARSPIALENKDLKAAIIIPPQAFLEKYIKDNEGKTDWNRIKEIKKNGISFIAPKSQWTNDFILENETSPTEEILNAKGKIHYVSPNKTGSYTIEKINNVPGVDYSYNLVAYAIKPDGHVERISSSTDLNRTGSYLEVNEQKMYQKLLEITTENQRMMNEFRRTGNTEALQRAQQYFNKPVYNGGFQ